MILTPSSSRNPPSVSFGPLVQGVFVERDNRFRVQVRIGTELVAAHLANSGRLGELLVPDRPVWLTAAEPASRRSRRTAWDLTLVASADRLVSVDSRVPGRLVEQALRSGYLRPFRDYGELQREVRLGASRLDFLAHGSGSTLPCWIEVKSVTLVTQGTARFPDAPTKRGRRHVETLISAVQEGARAAVVFVVQRDDAERLTPNEAADPAFAQSLRTAAQSGVEIHALRCRVTLAAIRLAGTIPVVL